MQECLRTTGNKTVSERSSNKTVKLPSRNGKNPWQARGEARYTVDQERRPNNDRNEELAQELRKKTSECLGGAMPVRDPLKQSGHYSYAVPKISYFYDQEEHYYIPDFAVYWCHKQPSIVECKPASKLDDPENLRKWTAARLWCKQNHYTFELVTDAALRQLGSLLSNIKLLAGHGHQQIAPQVKEYLLRKVQAENRALSVAELVERHPQYTPTIVRSCIWHLLYTRELSADLTKPLNVMTTLVWFSAK